MHELQELFNPGLKVIFPPQVFNTYEWFRRILKAMLSFAGGYIDEFGPESLVINSWFRLQDKQIQLLKEGKTDAPITEHFFAAAWDIEVPKEYQRPRFVDYIRLIMRIDEMIRIGWLSYQNPDKTFSHLHVGWGYMIPFEVIRAFVFDMKGLDDPANVFARINRSWKPGVKW